MTMNDVKQIFQSKFKNFGGKLKLDKNEDHSSFLPQYTDNLYQSAKINKEICNDIYKKMATTCIINYNTSDDKKTKKNSWETLSTTVSESEKKVIDDPLTRSILGTSVRAFEDLSRNTREFEKSLSSNVIKYFQEVSEDNNLVNIKKAMTSLSKDMKINTEKVLNLQEQINNSEVGLNRKSADIASTGSTESKLVNAQLAEENSEKELETKKDLFLSKLFAFEAEKLTTSEKMLEFFKEHLEYYIECKNILTKYIPELQMIIENNKKNCVFHLPLEEHIQSTNRKLSYVLETCIQELDNEETLQEEGLFRISGSKSKLELLKNALNLMKADENILKSCDSAVFTGVLKQYLRELPIPLMTYSLYDQWCEVGAKIRQSDIDGAKAAIKQCLTEMPRCHYDNLVYLMQFLKKVAENESVNKMNSSNLALMLGPNLIRNKSVNDNDDSDTSRVMMLSSPGSGVLDFMITHFYDIFPDFPIYTASKSRNVQNIKLPDKDLDKPKCLKSPRVFTDNDSLSSGELLLDDSSAGSYDNAIKSNKDTNAKPKLPRKPPAPPPPPAKVSIPEIEIDNISEEVKLKDVADSRPKVKKRTSVLEKSTEKLNFEHNSGDALVKRYSQKPISPPSLPTKRPTVSQSPEVTDKSKQKVEGAPPRRPNNPPPPIPSFDKLKESLDQKSSDSSTSKVEFRKSSIPQGDTSKSVEIESGHYSEGSHESTTF